MHVRPLLAMYTSTLQRKSWLAQISIKHRYCYVPSYIVMLFLHCFYNFLQTVDICHFAARISFTRATSARLSLLHQLIIPRLRMSVARYTVLLTFACLSVCLYNSSICWTIAERSLLQALMGMKQAFLHFKYSATGFESI